MLAANKTSADICGIVFNDCRGTRSLSVYPRRSGICTTCCDLQYCVGFRPQSKTIVRGAVATNLLALPFTWLARVSGEALLEMQGFSEGDPGPLAKHAEYANFLIVSVIVLCAAVVGFFLVDRFASLPTWLANVLRVVAVIAAIAVIVTVVMTGHEGAVQVWNG